MERFRAVLVACGAAACLAATMAHAAGGDGIIVRIRHDAAHQLQNLPELARLGLDGLAFHPVVDFELANPALATDLGLDRYFRLQLPPGTGPDEVIDALTARDDLFETVEPEYWGTIATTPNDPFFTIQWNLHNTGQAPQCGRSSGGRSAGHGDIRALNAWNITTGSTDVIIAIVDSGVTPHVDLPPLAPGWSHDDLGTTDQCNHGTHVAGIIAAASNNGIGITGIMWHATLVSVRVLTGCSGTDVNYGRGILWAADNAHIANSSLQYYSVGSFFTNALQYAHQQGLIMVAASGNNGHSVAFPARLPQVIAVGATTHTDAIASFSNAGSQLAISAPGDDVYSLSDTERINGAGTAYRCLSGTSMASPHVAATAGLIRTLNPDATHDEIRRIVTSTADDLGPPGWDPDFGWGRLNAWHALRLTQCYADCDLSGSLNIADFLCFIDHFVAGHPYADVNGDGMHNVADFLAYIDLYSIGCYE